MGPSCRTKSALLAAIREHPEEDTPRLAYAVWLDEQGGESNVARAEYIRLEIEIAHARVGHVLPPEWKERQKRARSLFAKHYREWFPELFGRKNLLRGVRGSPQMSRGFPYKLQGNSDKIISVGQRLVQLAPFIEFQLLDMTSRGLQQLVGAPWAGGLQELGLGGGYGSSQPDWAALADGTHFASLRDLAITFGWIDRAGAERVAAANPFPKLERFYFGTYSSDDAPGALFSGTTFTGLRSLHLSGGGRKSSNSPMPGLKEVCESRALVSLKAFDMSWRPTPGLTAMLTSSTFWPDLEELDLLRKELWRCWWNWRSRFWPDLEELDLLRNGLGDDDLAAMLNTSSKLRRIELDDNKITAKGAVLLAEHPVLANITTLDLSRNAIGDTGVTALANSPHARNLQKLAVSTCGFGLAGITALAESPHLANLCELRMHSNALDLKGRGAGRVCSPPKPSLTQRQRADRDRAQGAQGTVRRPGELLIGSCEGGVRPSWTQPRSARDAGTLRRRNEQAAVTRNGLARWLVRTRHPVEPSIRRGRSSRGRRGRWTARPLSPPTAPTFQPLRGTLPLISRGRGFQDTLPAPRHVPPGHLISGLQRDKNVTLGAKKRGMSGKGAPTATGST